MKHSTSRLFFEPAAIAQAVRLIVETFLGDAVPQNSREVLDPRFGERIETLAANVALWGSKMNLTAHPEEPEETAFHVIDSLMPILLGSHLDSPLAGVFDEGRTVLDLGSGAGFPGLVLAAASPADFTLIESRRKRASFLQVVAAEMGLRNARIEATRAETSQIVATFDLVAARAFGGITDFFQLAAATLKPGGIAMLYANPSQRLSLDDAREFGLSNYTRVPYVVLRRGDRVERILALWSKHPNSH